MFLQNSEFMMNEDVTSHKDSLSRTVELMEEIYIANIKRKNGIVAADLTYR